MDYQPILLIDQHTGKFARNDEHEGWMWTFFVHLATTFQSEGEAKTVARDKFPGRVVCLLERYASQRQ